MRRKLFFVVFILLFVSAAASATSPADDFMRIYDSHWRQLNFNYKLFVFVEKEFDEAVNAMTFGTSVFHFAFNRNNVMGKILSNIFTKFQPEYALFFKEFYEEYYKCLDSQLDQYSGGKVKQLLQKEEIIAVETKVQKKVLASIGQMSDTRFHRRLLDPDFSAMVLALGLLIIIFRNFVSKMCSSFSENDQKVKLIVSIIGIAILAFGCFHFSRGIFFTKGVMRELVNEEAKAFYTSELPKAYWATIEPHINDAIRSSKK